MRWGAVVVAGGRGSRLGGVDKGALVVGGRAMLDTVLLACAGADPVIVVGAERATVVPVRWVREEPAFGGPVAGLAAGLAVLPEDVDVVALLAADLPGLRVATVRRLLGVLGDPAGHVGAGAGADGVVLVDGEGREQWLVGVWRVAALRRVLPEEPHGAALRGVLGRLAVVGVPSEGDEGIDVDTPGDLHARHTDRPVI